MGAFSLIVVINLLNRLRMPKNADGLTNISLSSDSDHDHVVNADRNASHNGINDDPSTLNERSGETLLGASGDSGFGVSSAGTSSSFANGNSGNDLKPVDEEEESGRLIDQILDLQKTLDDLTSRMDSIKEDNLVLKSENQVLSQYIENVMKASSAFQQASPKSRKRSRSS